MGINRQSAPGILTADIGGSHITAGICDLGTHAISEQSIVRVEVNSKGSADDILIAWGNAFEQALDKNSVIQISGLGIAMPGPFDYEKGISYIRGLNKYEALYGINIKQYLATSLKLDARAVRFRNDAESTIAGEVLIGAGKDYTRVLGITLGTGFGSAYSENKITKDINLGSDAYMETIADDYLSTRWFLRRYQQLTGISLTGGVMELAELAPKSAAARGIFDEFAVNLCDFLSEPIERLKPEALVICGNIAKASHLFLPYLTRQLKTVTIRMNQLDESAALMGTAALFDNHWPPFIL
jgi:glucokinase